MPEIARPIANQKVRVCMYPDHIPAHIHVYGVDLRAWVPLSTLVPDPKRSRIARSARSDLKEVLEWAEKNKADLLQKWRDLRASHG